jgi:hypothetical protein
MCRRFGREQDGDHRVGDEVAAASGRPASAPEKHFVSAEPVNLSAF